MFVDTGQKSVLFIKFAGSTYIYTYILLNESLHVYIVLYDCMTLKQV